MANLSAVNEATPLDMTELQESLKEIQQGASSLLKQTKDRRLSVIPKDGENFDTTLDPWNINSPEDLTQSVESNVLSVLEMIQTLREQRDAGIHNTEQLDRYALAIGHYEKVNTEIQAKILALEREQKKTEVQQLREEDFTDLQDEVFALKQENKDLKKKQRTQSQPEVTKERLSPKSPDPPMFTDGVDPKWDEWHIKIMEKLDVNADHYPTESKKLIYTLSRIGGKAGEITYNRRRKGAEDPYRTLDELLDELSGLFEDQHREVTAEREFDELTMASSDSFRDFIYTFSRIIGVLHYNPDDRHIISSMKRKLPSRLRDHLMDKSFPTMKEYRDYLFRLDDNQRADWKLKVKSKEKETPRATASSPRRSTAASTALVPATSRAVAIPVRTPLQPSPDRNCWTCGKANCLPSQHAPNTPQNTAGRAAQLAIQATKVNEVGIHEIPGGEQVFGLDQVSSDEESKN